MMTKMNVETMTKSFRSKRGGLGIYAVIIILLLVLFIALYSFPKYLSMRSAIYKIACKEIRKKIERAVQEYEANNTKSIVKIGAKVDLDFLKATGFLAEIQRCPEGGRYIFGLNNEIICTVHSESINKDKKKETSSLQNINVDIHGERKSYYINKNTSDSYSEFTFDSISTVTYTIKSIDTSASLSVRTSQTSSISSSENKFQSSSNRDTN